MMMMILKNKMMKMIVKFKMTDQCMSLNYFIICSD